MLFLTLREVIAESGASKEPGVVPRSHSIRGEATAATFHRNWSVSSVLNVACWRSNSVFRHAGDQIQFSLPFT